MKRSVVSGSAIASPNTAEGVLLTLPPVPLVEEPGGFLWSHVVIDAFVNFTPGTLATGNLTFRIRRGTTIAGTLVGVALVVPCTAATPASFTFIVDDPVVASTPPTLPGQVYVVTVQQPGAATGPGTANYAVAHATAS